MITQVSEPHAINLIARFEWSYCWTQCFLWTTTPIGKHGDKKLRAIIGAYQSAAVVCLRERNLSREHGDVSVQQTIRSSPSWMRQGGKASSVTAKSVIVQPLLGSLRRALTSSPPTGSVIKLVLCRKNTQRRSRVIGYFYIGAVI